MNQNDWHHNPHAPLELRIAAQKTSIAHVSRYAQRAGTAFDRII